MWNIFITVHEQFLTVIEDRQVKSNLSSTFSSEDFIKHNFNN